MSSCNTRSIIYHFVLTDVNVSEVSVAQEMSEGPTEHVRADPLQSCGRHPSNLLFLLLSLCFIVLISRQTLTVSFFNLQPSDEIHAFTYTGEIFRACAPST